MARRHDEQDHRTEDRRRESGIDETFDHGCNDTLDETQDVLHDMFLMCSFSSLHTLTLQSERRLRVTRTLRHPTPPAGHPRSSVWRGGDGSGALLAGRPLAG